MRWLVSLAAVAGCADDVDLAGMYRVDHDTASAPCGLDEAVTGGPAFLHFHEEEVYGQRYFTYDECRDAEAVDCPISAGLVGGFFEPVDRGWMGRASSS